MCVIMIITTTICTYVPRVMNRRRNAYHDHSQPAWCHCRMRILWTNTFIMILNVRGGHCTMTLGASFLRRACRARLASMFRPFCLPPAMRTTSLSSTRTRTHPHSPALTLTHTHPPTHTHTHEYRIRCRYMCMCFC